MTDRSQNAARRCQEVFAAIDALMFASSKLKGVLRGLMHPDPASRHWVNVAPGNTLAVHASEAQATKTPAKTATDEVRGEWTWLCPGSGATFGPHAPHVPPLVCVEWMAAASRAAPRLSQEEDEIEVDTPDRGPASIGGQTSDTLRAPDSGGTSVKGTPQCGARSAVSSLLGGLPERLLARFLEACGDQAAERLAQVLECALGAGGEAVGGVGAGADEFGKGAITTPVESPSPFGIGAWAQAQSGTPGGCRGEEETGAWVVAHMWHWLRSWLRLEAP